MSIKTDYILKALNVLSWIVFIGLCFEAGGFMVNTIATLMLTPEGTSGFWKEVNLDAVYRYNESHYVTLAVLMIIAAVLKALMFYLIITIFYNKKFNLSKPFNETTKRFALNLGYLSLGIGFFSFWGSKVAETLAQEGVDIPDLQYLRLAGADIWLFMGIVLLIIAFIFKKGIEIQNENDLTV